MGPLVLLTDPLKFPNVHTGYKPNCLTRVSLKAVLFPLDISTITGGTDYIFILAHDVLWQGADVL